MTSTTSTPQSQYEFFIEGDTLSIYDITADPVTAPAENVTAGLLIHYYGYAKEIETEDDYPDIDSSLHAGLVDAIKAKLYDMEAGKAAVNGNVEQATALTIMANRHKKIWLEQSRKYLRKKTNKIAGPYTFRPARLKNP